MSVFSFFLWQKAEIWTPCFHFVEDEQIRCFEPYGPVKKRAEQSTPHKLTSESSTRARRR
ncbi:hypothetical protein JJJ17_18630 [Paracoccus caeni]|uniref:Uncharacterized protein n=1 Tax=Paracoccus caeni TaxID=657651 RepID=A0A934W2N1_9RHOB|nr:hypothetical protein [Paracoccus caeni]MBK4217949.1 hypothetical protein [Paracoccus caeni]